jgi:hypothetical protein
MDGAIRWSLTTATPPLRTRPRWRAASSRSNATRKSASPSGIADDRTSSPYRTVVTTVPPRWDMPWTSDVTTSWPASSAAVASTRVASTEP